MQVIDGAEIFVKRQEWLFFTCLVHFSFTIAMDLVKGELLCQVWFSLYIHMCQRSGAVPVWNEPPSATKDHVPHGRGWSRYQSHFFLPFRFYQPVYSKYTQTCCLLKQQASKTKRKYVFPGLDSSKSYAATKIYPEGYSHEKTHRIWWGE